MNQNILRSAGIGMLLFIISIHTDAENITRASVHAGPEDSTIVFISTGMGCSEDNKMVEKALFRKKGVKQVVISGDTVTVRFRPGKTTASELAAAIESTGTCEDPNARVHKVMIKPD